jgi:hypothetical protein
MYPYYNAGSSFVWLIFMVLMVYSHVRIFQKANHAWWEAIIPIYSTYVLIKITGKPGWWIILLFVPIVNIVIYIIVTHQLSVKFGHGGAFTLGLLFLPFIFYPILGLGDSVYMPERAAATTPAL